jgi:signal transduction histidine kinase
MSLRNVIARSAARVQTYTLWRVFRFGEAEIAFQRHLLPRTHSSLRLALIGGSVLFLAFSAADIEALGYVPHALLLMLARMSFVLTAMCCLYCLHRWPTSIVVPLISANVITVVGMSVFMAITWYVPTEFLRQALSICSLLILLYFFVPNLLGLSTALGLLSTAAFILVAAKQHEIRLSDTPTMVMLLLINVFGFVVAARLQRHLRDEFQIQVTMERQAIALNNALQFAQEMNRQKVETIGYIGHDLRAPLSTIRAYSRRLLGRDRGEQIPLIHAIERSIGYQLGLIEELMEYAKAELHPLDINAIPTDMSAVMFDIAEYAAALCAQQNNEFHYELPAGLPALVECDGRRLQQVLLNLLSNASKFTREGTVTLTVTAAPAGQQLRIGFEVSDTGIGMDLTQHTDIFGAFQQTQENSGGTGLGLYIAHRIVNAMGGELRVASAPGQGTTFSFELTTQALKQEAALPSEVPPPTAALSGIARHRSREWMDQERPPQADLGDLALFAKQGGLTDIEQWIGKFSEVAGYSTFLTEVQQRLGRLDFLGIVELADSAGRTPHA